MDEDLALFGVEPQADYDGFRGCGADLAGGAALLLDGLCAGLQLVTELTKLINICTPNSHEILLHLFGPELFGIPSGLRLIRKIQ